MPAKTTREGHHPDIQRAIDTRPQPLEPWGMMHILETCNRIADERDRLKSVNAELVAALEQAIAYVTRVQSHKGCMNADELRKAEEEFARTVPYVAAGRWAGDMVEFDLQKARAAIERASK